MNYVANESATATTCNPAYSNIRTENGVRPAEDLPIETVRSIVDDTNGYLKMINSRLYGLNKFVFKADYLPDDDSDNECLMDVLLENRQISCDVANKLYEIMNKLGI